MVKQLKVKNTLGLHARPATMIAKILQKSRSHVSLTYKKETVDARSIMGILMLAVKKNSWITLTVEGEDAEEMIEQLTSVFESAFGEKPL